ERHDFHETLATQLTRNRPENTRTDRLELAVQQHCGVAVKLDQRTVLATHALGSTNHHGIVDFAFLNATTRSSGFDGDLDHVADTGIAALGTTQHLDAHNFTCTRVVGYFEPALSFNHDFSFTT